MKKLFSLIALILVQFLFAQEVTRELAPFTEIKVYDRISAELIKSDQNKIEISGARSQEVEVLQKKDEVKIRMPFSKLLKGEDISVKVYYSGKLSEIDAYEGSFITSQDVISAFDLELEVKEGAEMKLELAVTELEVKVVTGGFMHLTGEVKGEMEATIKTGGQLKAQKLLTKRTDVSISAGGEAEIYATDYVKARVKAGGDILIYGTPAYIDQKTFAGGTITLK